MWNFKLVAFIFSLSFSPSHRKRQIRIFFLFPLDVSWDGIWHLVFLFLELTLDTSKWFSVVAVVDLKVWSCKLRLDATWVHKLLLCRSLAAFNRWISIIDLPYLPTTILFAHNRLLFCANCTDYYPWPQPIVNDVMINVGHKRDISFGHILHFLRFAHISRRQTSQFQKC